jgi:hypothetical protein
MSPLGLKRPTVVFGFLAGALAVPLFHQVMLAILYASHFVARAPFSLQPTKPLGLPAVVSLTFWGGVWGIIFAMVSRSRPRLGYWTFAVLFGAIFPTVVAWFLVLPLKGIPAGGGWAPRAVATALLVNGAWGLGTALFLRIFSRGR